MKKKLILALTFVLIASMLFGCGPTTEPTAQPGASTAAQPTAQPGGSTAAPAAADPTPDANAKSTTFNVVTSDSLIRLDPHDLTTPGDEYSYRMTYEPLVDTDHRGNLTGVLAESWEFNEDSTEITFKLVEGVTFSNGEPFNADVVVYNIDRLVEKIDVLAVPMLYFPVLTGGEAVDEYTVKMIFSEPHPLAMAYMHLFLMIPMEAHQTAGDDMFAQCENIGTGPWIFDEFVSGQYVHMTKNENYRDLANYDSYFNDGYIRFVTEHTSAAAAQISGDADVYTSFGGIGSDVLPLYAGTEDRIDVITAPINQYSDFRMGFTSLDSPLYDAKVREAMSLAIDRQLISDTIFEGAGVPLGIISEDCIGYDPNLEPYVYDPELAKQVLAESTYDGRELMFLTSDAFVKCEDCMLAVTSMLEEVGFNINPMSVDLAAFDQLRLEGNWDLMYASQQFINGEPYLFMTSRYVTDYMGSGWEGPEAEELIDLVNQYCAESDPEVRKELARQVNEWNKNWFGPTHGVSKINGYYAVTKGMTGIQFMVDGYEYFTYIDWDPALAAN